MNITKRDDAYQEIGSLLKTLGHPIRLRILQEVADGEVCVCHLETQLDIRQALLSQHLMALREAGVLVTRRDGRFIFYRIADQRYLEIIDSTVQITGLKMETLTTGKKDCDCPKCCSK